MSGEGERRSFRLSRGGKRTAGQRRRFAAGVLLSLSIYSWMYFAQAEPRIIDPPKDKMMSEVCDEPHYRMLGGSFVFAPIHWVDKTLLRSELWKDLCE